MRLSPVGLAALIATALATAAPPTVASQPAPSSPLFRIETGEFWLNLHHFLYVLGRAPGKTPDTLREAVAGAPAEAERGLATLSPDERKIWADAVAGYARELSQKDIMFDEPLPEIASALTRADDAPNLRDVRMDGKTRDILERAAPVYRKAWWPAHRASNQAWQADIESLVAKHGVAVLGFITNAYGLPWPAGGFPIHAARFANWAGAYSTRGNLLVLSTVEAGTRGTNGLETVFHEAMHQWDGQVLEALARQARIVKVGLPRDLFHALIFYTAGEAVRRVVPTHVPYAEAFGVWSRRLSGSPLPAQRLKDALDELWKPYLDGRGTRDEAFAALLAKVGIRP